MQQNHSISRYKQKLLIFLSALFIAFIITPPKEVYATSVDGNYAGWASSLVHSDGNNNQGGADYIPNGVSYTRTGYIAYLLTVDGASVPGCDAIAFKSPGFVPIDGAVFIATSRRGHTVGGDAGFAGGIALWACTPWQQGGSPINEPVIKQWFEGMNDTGGQNGIQFVFDKWGVEAARKYRDNEYINTLRHR